MKKTQNTPKSFVGDYTPKPGDVVLHTEIVEELLKKGIKFLTNQFIVYYKIRLYEKEFGCKADKKLYKSICVSTDIGFGTNLSEKQINTALYELKRRRMIDY